MDKNSHFWNFFFLGNIGQENVFYDILERKNVFLGYKNKKFKKLKNSYYSKGVNPWFLYKNGYFCNFFFVGNTGHENVVYDILHQKKKNVFICEKNKKFNKSKNCHFSKVVNPWFLDKNGHFCIIFFFKQSRPGKFFLRHSKTKKRLSRLWKQEV